MKKIDPYEHRERYLKWKKTAEIKGITSFNAKLIVEYLNDMEEGFNVARKGSRSYIRLNNLRQRLTWLIKNMEDAYKIKKITDITERQATSFFNDLMRNGKIVTRSGRAYTSVQDYVWVFKAFWHWYQRRENANGNLVKDITLYMDTNPVKESSFVYFTIDDMKRMADRSKYEYKVLMWFLFDTGIRAPTELMNMRVSDLSLLDDGQTYQLDIRNDVSKTFGRKIKLVLCSRLLREYIKAKGFKDDDVLFPIIPRVVNQYIKRIAVKVLGKYKTKGGQNIKDISLYDFRHSSSCYWLPRYKSESALKYRFGWKRDDMIHHYTKLLGMRDTIEEQDILLDSEAKTKLENELEFQKKKNLLMDDTIKELQQEMKIIKDTQKRHMAEEVKKIPEITRRTESRIGAIKKSEI